MTDKIVFQSSLKSRFEEKWEINNLLGSIKINSKSKRFFFLINSSLLFDNSRANSDFQKKNVFIPQQKLRVRVQINQTLIKKISFD